MVTQGLTLFPQDVVGLICLLLKYPDLGLPGPLCSSLQDVGGTTFRGPGLD